jgi:hypothetical protein
MPVCNKCQRAIAPQTPIASFESRTYHPDCLVCKVCTKSVSGQKFLKDKNQDIICESCDLKYGPVCTKCRKNFKPGESYKKLDENVFYHYTCFSCYGPCRKPIEAEFYELDGNQFICTDCFDKYGARKTYDDLVASNSKPSPIVAPALGTNKPTNNDRTRNTNYDRDNEVNTLSSNFSVNLNTKESANDDAKTNNNNSERRNRFENPSSNSKPPTETKSSLICEKCKLPIQGTYSAYNDKNYHTKCFTCSRCNTEFKGKQFFKLDGLPVCNNCHDENLMATSSKCKKCKKPILDTVLTFMNEEYHESCLACTSCARKLVGLSIYTDKQKNPFCTDCFTKKEAKVCAKCSRPILPSQSNIVFEDKPFHKECFTCDTCNRQISAEESFFKNDDDNIICNDCSSSSTF